MKLVATVYEATMAAAVDAIRHLPDACDMIEVRAERFPAVDLRALRGATAKPLLLTYRSAPGEPALPMRDGGMAEAIAAGIEYVDVEWGEDVVLDVPERTVLSHHDFAGVQDAAAIFAKMLARGCAHTKLAMTPATFSENQLLLDLLRNPRARSEVTIIGMGERGLYSRILAPFRGSALAFVAASHVAAPGQLTLERAQAIYGAAPLFAEKIFAVAGNPAGHSLSPAIHNALFRERNVPAAYTIASFESFSEISDAFLRGEPCGLSVTSPFKDDAFAFAMVRDCEMGENALQARAVNTLVNVEGRILADNTDVDGFAMILPPVRKAAIVGAGGTSRAARVALERRGVPVITYNRTASKADAPLEALASFDGDCIVNTVPAGSEVRVPPCRVYVEAAYGGSVVPVEAEIRIGGLDLLHAQAHRQHELFMKVFDGI